LNASINALSVGLPGHRRGAYLGREAEWVRQDADVIAAGREGRILGAVDVEGK
jgi:hypothetical protein